MRFSHFDKICYRNYLEADVAPAWFSWKLAQLKPYFTEGRNRISVGAFHICCPAWVKYGTTDLCVMLLSIYEFTQIRRRWVHNYLIGKNKITSFQASSAVYTTSSLFWGVTQCLMIVTDVLGQPIGLIFKGQDYLTFEYGTDRLCCVAEYISGSFLSR
jgi:hypothetical protein